MTAIIETKGLTKRLGGVQVLDGLDIVAQSGRVTALLGPNGAGKTTFVSAIATLLRPKPARSSWRASRRVPSPSGCTRSPGWRANWRRPSQP
jgi:ABC-type multidrug transport system ATPase subunit